MNQPDSVTENGHTKTVRLHQAKMQDLKAKLEKLLTDAEDCDLIAKLATDNVKRETFNKLARQLRQMAAEVEAVLKARQASNEQ